jgi:hypothetical protein
MVIEEGLHRRLPEPINRYEKIVKSITRIITTNSGSKSQALKAYLQKIQNVKLPWQVRFEVRGYTLHAPIIKQKLQSTNRVIETTGPARIVILLSQESAYNGGFVAFKDTYNNTVKTLPANFMWKRIDYVTQQDYQSVVDFVLTELKQVEFLQSL